MDLRAVLDDVRYALVDHPRRVAAGVVALVVLAAAAFLVPSLLGSGSEESPLASGPPMVSQAEGDCADRFEEVGEFVAAQPYDKVRDSKELSKELSRLTEAHRKDCPVREQDVLYNTTLGPWMLSAPLAPTAPPAPSK